MEGRDSKKGKNEKGKTGQGTRPQRRTSGRSLGKKKKVGIEIKKKKREERRSHFPWADKQKIAGNRKSVPSAR